MPKPQRPLEFFGYYTGLPAPTTGPWEAIRKESASAPYREFPCPFTSSPCDKIRKAAPNPLIGNCSVRVASAKRDLDWIVCPKRFLQENIIFRDCFDLLGKGSAEVYVAREIGMGHYGQLDYALVGYDKDGGTKDFLGIEIQGMGTSNSGGIWNARNDYLQGRLGTYYSYNVNLKDASKKILVQLLHKGAQLARWRSSLVLVVQDWFLEHLRESYNIRAHFHDQEEQDFIHIHSYEFKFDSKTNRYGLVLKERKSTDILGLSMALISNPGGRYLKFSSMTEKIDNKKRRGELEKIERARARNT